MDARAGAAGSDNNSGASVGKRIADKALGMGRLEL